MTVLSRHCSKQGRSTVSTRRNGWVPVCISATHWKAPGVHADWPQEMEFCRLSIGQKNPRAHKNKIGTSPPPQKTPKNAEFYGHGFSCRKNAFFQASIKLAQPFPAPELRTRILRTRGFFWIGPGRLRPVIIKPVGRIFEISDSNPTRWKCGKSLSPQKNLGRHVCRTKLPPKNFEIDTKNGLKNAKKDPKNDPKRVWKMFSPSQAA